MIEKKDVLSWLERFQQCVRSFDYEAARPMFDDDVLAFGSLTDVMTDRNILENNQWRNVWPRIKDFSFETETLRLFTELPVNTITLACLWRSLGVIPSGYYERRGRVTMVLRRRHNQLLCVHSHFSMEPGIPALADA